MDSRELGATWAMSAAKEALEQRGWNYEAHGDNEVFTLTVKGEDLPMQTFITTDREKGIFQVFSPMPFIIKPEKVIDAAMIANAYNGDRFMGSFEIDLTSGEMQFKYTTFVDGCKISVNTVQAILQKCYQTIDDYNDKFMLLNNGHLSVDQILRMMA